MLAGAQYICGVYLVPGVESWQPGEEVANAILKPVKHFWPKKILGFNIDQIMGSGAFGLVYLTQGNFGHTVCLFPPIMQHKTSPITSTVPIIGKTDSQEAVLKESTVRIIIMHCNR